MFSVDLSCYLFRGARFREHPKIVNAAGNKQLEMTSFMATSMEGSLAGTNTNTNTRTLRYFGWCWLLICVTTWSTVCSFIVRFDCHPCFGGNKQLVILQAQ